MRMSFCIKLNQNTKSFSSVGSLDIFVVEPQPESQEQIQSREGMFHPFCYMYVGKSEGVSPIQIASHETPVWTNIQSGQKLVSKA